MPAYLVTLPDNGRFYLPENVTDVVVFAADAADAKAVAKSLFSSDSDASWAASTATEIVAGSDLSGDEWSLRVAILDSDPVVDVKANGGVSGVVSGAVNAGGSSYVVGDVITVAGGTSTRAATFRVLTVSTGAITSVELVDPGEYTADPTLVGNAVTGGSGTSATLDLTMGVDTYANFLAEMVGLLNASSIIAGAALDLGEAGVGASDLTLTIASAGDGLGDKDAVVEFNRNGVNVPSLTGAVTDTGSAGAALNMAVTASANISVPNVVAKLRQ